MVDSLVVTGGACQSYANPYVLADPMRPRLLQIHLNDVFPVDEVVTDHTAGDGADCVEPANSVGISSGGVAVAIDGFGDDAIPRYEPRYVKDATLWGNYLEKGIALLRSVLLLQTVDRVLEQRALITGGTSVNGSYSGGSGYSSGDATETVPPPADDVDAVYDSLEGGEVAWGLRHLVGGIVWDADLSEASDAFSSDFVWGQLKLALLQKSLISTHTKAVISGMRSCLDVGASSPCENALCILPAHVCTCGHVFAHACHVQMCNCVRVCTSVYDLTSLSVYVWNCQWKRTAPSNGLRRSYVDRHTSCQTRSCASPASSASAPPAASAPTAAH